MCRLIYYIWDSISDEKLWTSTFYRDWGLAHIFKGKTKKPDLCMSIRRYLINAIREVARSLLRMDNRDTIYLSEQSKILLTRISGSDSNSKH